MFRLGSAAVVLGLGVLTTAACAETVRGKASLPQNNADFAHDPQITNLGVDAPVLPSQRQSQNAPRNAGPGGSSASDSTLGDYLDGQGISAYPVPAGAGLTVEVSPPTGWQASKPENDSQQVALELPAAGGDGVYAFMTVDVYRLSEAPPAADLVAAAKNSIAAAGNVQTADDQPYQGNASTAGIVAVTSKQGSRVVKVLRYTFVRDNAASATYIVASAVVCGTESWQSMRDDLLRLDSGMRLRN